jgi:acyl-CoA synthetase (AMP-forming)/AMP-acid ligase II
MPSTIAELLNAGAESAPAIAALDRPPLSYAGLRAQARATVAALNGLGVGRGDRVAIVLPNGPEMATAFLCVGAGAVAAPLNPAYRAEEFEFYLTDLRAKALIVEAGATGPAVEVARRLGVAVLALSAGATAGAFTLAGEGGGAAARPGLAEAGDIALILHTSGTTSRPKIVPLSHRNVTASARNIAATLSLKAEDRGLNIMPLFHIHGLIAGLLAPLARGGAIVCTPGFNALRFFGQMREARPTWVTAVPTMHQAILSRAAQNRDVIAAHPLRFLRSSSSSMPRR